MRGVEYSANNSGGGWWLSDDDWYALERAGWIVDWYKDQTDWNGRPYPDGQFLGALATRAFLPHATESEAIESWQNATGQWASEIGCECCGPPHDFWETGRNTDEVS